MDASPGTDLGTVGWFAGTWILMMAAMMLPSFVPAVIAYATSSRGASRGSGLIFVAGYLLVWATVGLAAYGIFGVGKAALGHELAWHEGGRWFSAGVVAAAAIYEVIPLKQACLSRCRGQLADARGFAAHGWRVPLAMGSRSGIWCLGSSWALMAALFALGVMNLTWMAVVAGLVALEKAGPWPPLARTATAAVLALLAVGILAAPHDVPGLVIPSSGGMHAMN
jgi:predicted metal-binding membrane protein